MARAAENLFPLHLHLRLLFPCCASFDSMHVHSARGMVGLGRSIGGAGGAR